GVAAEDGGGLVTKRFAAAGGQDDDRVAAVEDGAHGPFLKRPEGVVAPVAFDDALEAVEAVRGGLRRDGPDPLQTLTIHDRRTQVQSGCSGAGVLGSQRVQFERNVVTERQGTCRLGSARARCPMPLQLWPDPRDGLDPAEAPWDWDEVS